MKVAITGGSGVVGSTLLRHLAEAGHEVKALARQPRAGAAIADLGGLPVPGDILSFESVRELVDGCELVFNVAGVNEMCSANPDHMWRVNVEGLRVVMNACRDSNVVRLVHTSSAVTIGEEQGTVATEDSPHRGHFLSKYEESKHAAERLLFEDARGLDVVAVNPSSVQGPGRATGTGRLFLAAAQGRLRFAVDTSVSFVDIDDCARGHLLAADEGESGQRYILSGAVVPIREAILMLAETIGAPIPVSYLPKSMAYGISTIPEALFGLVGKRAPVCREAIRVMTHGHYYDGSRATRKLGLEYTPIRETLERTVGWFREEGLLSGSAA